MSNKIDLLSPDASPGSISKRSGVRRVNNIPVYLIVSVVVTFLIIMAFVAADRAADQNKPNTAETDKGGNSRLFANEITGDRKDGIIAADKVAPPTVPDLAAVPIARPDNLDAPPTPPQLHAPLDDELVRIRQAKIQQLEEAIRAKSSVQSAPMRSRASTDAGALGNNSAPVGREDTLGRLAAVRQQIDSSTRNDPTAAYKARLAQLQGSGLISNDGGSNDGSGTPQLLQAAASGGRNNVGQFAGSGKDDRWKMDSQPEAPRSPYELRAGFVVPATLISGINSDLPGQIMAQVSQDVYDTPTGKYKLIPQGSRLVGSYSNDVAYGQSRVLVAWQRIVFPDGKAMDIGAMPGADGAGYSGFKDQVNNHYFRLFGSAFLMSGVTAGITLSQGNKNQNPSAPPTASSAMSEALGQQLGQVTAQMISKNLNVAPTLEIRPGFRFNVIVIKDMTFSKPYQSFDY